MLPKIGHGNGPGGSGGDLESEIFRCLVTKKMRDNKKRARVGKRRLVSCGNSLVSDIFIFIK